MSLSVLMFTGKTATTAGSLVLDGIGAVTAPPPGVVLSEARSAALSELVGEARVAQDGLSVSLSAIDTLAAQHEKEVQNALKADKELDASFSAIQSWISAASREGDADAADLARLFFPDGSSPVTLPEGSTQLGLYESWLLTAASEAATSNPAYGIVAGKITAFADKVAAFKATLTEKSRLAGELSAARAKRDAAQAAWTATFTDLIATIARLHGEDSAAFRAWISPVLSWKAAQKAMRSRQANAAAEPPAPDEPTPTGEGSG